MSTSRLLVLRKTRDGDFDRYLVRDTDTLLSDDSTQSLSTYDVLEPRKNMTDETGVFFDEENEREYFIPTAWAIMNREVYVYLYSVTEKPLRNVNFQQLVGNRDDDTLVINSYEESRPFNLRDFEPKSEGFSLERCDEQLNVLTERMLFIHPVPRNQILTSLLNVLAEKSATLIVLFFSRGTLAFKELLRSHIKEISSKLRRASERTAGIILDFLDRLSPSFRESIDAAIFRAQRRLVDLQLVAKILRKRLEEVRSFERSLELYEGLQEAIGMGQALSQKERKNAQKPRPRLVPADVKTAALADLALDYEGDFEPIWLNQIRDLVDISARCRRRVRQVYDKLLVEFCGCWDNIELRTLIFHQSCPLPPSQLPITPPPILSIEVFKALAPHSVHPSATSATISNSRPKKSSGQLNDAPSIPFVPSAPSIPVDSAYPAVQPLKAAAHFDQPSSVFGAWIILLSGRALRDFRQIKDGKKFLVVQKKLIDLSHGRFGPDNCKTLVGTATEVPIFEAKVLNDLRLVYQIDIMDDGDQSTQIIRVWGLESHNTLDRRVWEAISRHSKTRGTEYRRRCLFRREAIVKGAKVQDVTAPQTFPIIDDSVVLGVPIDNQGMSDKEMLELHDLLALSKFIPLSIAVVKSILAQDEEASHIFNVSPREREIIAHESSSFVIGRSGTGKTTCVVFKMLGLEKAYQTSPEIATRGKLRQLFLTQSPVLASKVKSYYQAIVDTASTADLSAKELAALVQKREAAVADDLEDLEDVAVKGLPPRFSQLTDEHFPLFISVDTLLYLLEADYGIDWGRKKQTAGSKQAFRRFAIANVSQETDQIRTPVEFDDDGANPLVQAEPASKDLWLHYVDAAVFGEWFRSFDSRLTKGLDVTLTWNEILGTILGSEKACGTVDGYLSRQQYETLSERTNSIYFDLRPNIYSIFELYLREKGRRGDFDRADRTHALIKALKADGLPLDQQVDYVYVDEVQDLLLSHCTLLRHLTSNPYGWLFAGDTAQTIAAGSSFRFEDLKAVVWRAEERDALLMKRKPVKSSLFTLAVNYRSHTGITNFGNILVQSILKLFPDSIDRLPAEKGLVSGPKPVWLSGRDEESFTSFLFGESGSAVEFGAEQCILVRNEEARSNLRRLTSDIGLILTIEEAKGLEFSDVLLFDFFSDSKCSENDWRVLLRLLPEPPENVPSFDKVRHAAIGNELRHLYVAVTRARNVLWLVNRDSKGEAVRQFLDVSNIIKTCSTSEELPVIGAASSPEQWKKQARVMYHRKNYRQAALCFKKAGAFLEESISLAYQDRQEVRAATRLGKSSKLDHARVGTAFRQCAQSSTSTQAISLFLVAGESFHEAKKLLLAAQCFESGEMYDRAAKLFLNCDSYDEAVRVCQIRLDSSAPTYKEVFYSAQLYYLNNNLTVKARALFDTSDAQLEFMEEHGLDGQRLDFFVSMERFLEAAELEYAEGHLENAYRLCLKCGSREALLLCTRSLLELLAQTLPLGCSDDWEQYSEPLKKATGYVADCDRVLQRIEGDFFGRGKIELDLKLYRLITSKSVARLLLLSREYKTQGDKASQFQALDMALSANPVFGVDATFEAIGGYLDHIQEYCDLVEGITSNIVVSDPNVKRLFGLDSRTLYADEAESSELRVLSTSPLCNWLPPPSDPFATADKRSVLASQAHRYIKEFLVDRLDNYLFDCSSLLRKVALLRQPCSRFLLSGHCQKDSCSQQHLAPVELTQARFQQRITLLSRVISLVGRIDAASGTPEENLVRRQEQKKWEDQLISAIYPLHSFAGGITEAHDMAQTQSWQQATSTLARQAHRDLLSYGYSQPNVLASFITNALVSSDYARSNLDRLPILQRSLRRDLRDSDGQLITAKLGWLLSLKSDANVMLIHLIHGKESLGRILQMSTPVDALSLAHYVEELVIITFIRSQFGGVEDWGFHRIVLPKSLMKRLIRNQRNREVVQQVSRTFRLELVELIRRLTTDVLEGAQNLLLEGQTQSRYPAFVLANRLIRLLVLIGVNSDDLQIKAKTEKAIKSLRDIGPRAFDVVLTQPFLRANSLLEMQRLMIDQSRKYSLDHIVQLDLTPEGVLNATTGVVILRSPKLSGIERLLFGQLLGALSPRAAVFVPAAQRQQEVEETAVATETKGASNMLATDEEVAAKQEAEEAAAAFKENGAARIIQIRLIRPTLARLAARKAFNESPFIVMWTKWQQSARKSVIVLGPLIEMVFAMESVKRLLRKLDQKLKTSLKKKVAQSGKLLEVGTAIKSTRKLIRSFDTILKKLTPASPLLTTEYSLLNLRSYLANVPDLFHEAINFLNTTATDVNSLNDLSLRFKLGEKGILRIAKVKVAQKVEKPNLGPVDTDGSANKEEEDEEEEEAEARGRVLAAVGRRG